MSIKLLVILRNTPDQRLDLCLNEADKWFRLRYWDLDINEPRVKELGIAPEEMAEIVKVALEVARKTTDEGPTTAS